MPLPFSTKYAIAKNMAAMQTAKELNEREKDRILLEYVKKDENGEPIKEKEGYPLENPEAYYRETEELDNQEVEDIVLTPIKLSDLEKVNDITVEMLMQIIDIIQEDK